MKATLYDSQGNSKGEINLPKIFDTPIREDLVLKYFLVERFMNMHPYSHDPRAGRKHSASGTISHRRHEWKGHYGQGRSRVPRKTMWRRGTQFYWVAAEVSGTRGGRRVHGPVLEKASKKINKKEVILALKAALASTMQKSIVTKRYSSLSNLKSSIAFPIILESNIDKIKAKNFLTLLEKILGDVFKVALRNNSVRSGKGKGRGRSHKSNAGLLLVKSKAENIKLSRIEVKSVQDIKITDLYPLGRLTIYTEKALSEIQKRIDAMEANKNVA